MFIKYIKNGVIAERELTAEEIAALEAQATEQPEPTPTIEERMASVEEDTKVIRAILMGEEGETK